MFKISLYPEQIRSRKAYALLGLLFLLFGAVTAFWGAMFLALLGIFFGTAMLVPALWLDQKDFIQFEEWFARIAIWGNL